MVKFQAVGRSDRTPIKHWLLDKALGQLVGVVSSGKAPCISPVLMVDMCAGDGHTTELTVPKVWTAKYMAMTPKMSELTEYQVGAASWRTQRKAFDAQLRELFLTTKERQ